LKIAKNNSKKFKINFSSFELEKRGLVEDSGIHAFRYAFSDSTLNVDVQREQGFCNPNSADYFKNSSIQEGEQIKENKIK